MKKRMIGNLEVSEVAMGCMGFSHGYGKVPEESYSIEAIQEAYQFGCTFLIQLKLMDVKCFMKDIMNKLSVKLSRTLEKTLSLRQNCISIMKN